MKIFNKVQNMFKRMPKKLIALFVVALLMVGATAMVKAEFYPDRPTFDYNKACNASDADIYDRCGSLTGPVFNSFINTPSYGDERAFADARKSENTAAGSYKNVLNDVTTGSKEVVVRMYIHNNANVDTNSSGKGIARNTKVRVALPTAQSQTLRARGYISADNASMVEDTVDFVGASAFKVEYVPGSALIYNNGPLNGSKISDSVVTTGAPIGYDKLDGNLPGCFEHEAVVQIRVRVITQETPTLKFSKQVRVAGTKEWKKEVSAKPGDKVEWLLTTNTTGTGVQNNMVVRDVPAPNTALEAGSVKWIDASQNAVQADKPLFDGGINVGNYNTGSGFYMMYASTVKGDFDGCEARVRNLGYVRSDQNKEIGDDADVVITKENCQPAAKPVYTCDSLTKTSIGDRNYRFKVAYTAKDGAKLKMFTYDFGDGSDKFVTDKDTVEHVYAKDGNFVARVAITFTVDGKDKVVDSDRCSAPITTSTAPTPETPKLVVTGPGDVAGMFAGVSAFGASLHQVVTRRRTRRS